MNDLRLCIPCVLAVVLALSVAADGQAAPPKPPAKPADIEISVAPEAAPAGGEARVSLQLTPIEGVKINRYPKIKLKVPAHDGLVAEAEAAVGNAKPPPPDKLDKNYFEEVEPVELLLKLDAAAPRGKHEIKARLSYAYCVIKSGYCAPVRVPVTIPVQIR